MSWKPILWLVACVVLTGLFIGLFERGSKPSAHSLPVDMPLLHLSQDSVTHLSIVSGGDGVECVRRDGQWFLVKPVETRADSAGVNRLVSAILAMRKQEVIDLDRQEKRKLTLASFGLESPRARLRIGSDFRVDEILVGDSSPLRNTVYVRLNDGTDVIGITCQVSEILPLDAAALQDRAAFPASIRQAVRLEVKHPGGFFQLALRDGSWRIQQPYDALADGGRVERLLQSLSQLTIADFGGTNGLVTPETCGLGGDETALQVSVWPLGQRDPFVLTVGKPRPDNPSWLYARISDGERICAVGKEVLSLQNLKAESLRDRRICDADPSLIASVTLRDGDAKMVIQKTDGSLLNLFDLRPISVPSEHC